MTNASSSFQPLALPVMRKVLVIGSGGAGKSTVARRLSELLNIQVLHLDQFYWSSGWIEMEKPEWTRTVEQLLAKDEWIMDGNYSGTLDLRVAACDTVVFLDLPRTVCLWRVLKRAVIYRNRSRPDMAAGCHEKLNWKFVAWIWNYPRRSRSGIVQLLEAQSDEKTIVWLRSQSDLNR